ncbi:MAG TPA: signal peptide peptidase SppA, partial [Chroococcales cyanobacterium]
AYYISAAADRILANPASTVGSIGVILHTTDVSGLMGKLGVRAAVIKSGTYKDILSPYRAMTRDEKNILQTLVDETYGQFVAGVARGRRQPLAAVKAVADGRIFTGTSAQKAGLVDDLGSYLDAVRFTAKLVGLKGEPNIRNYTSVSFWEKVVPRLESCLPFLPQGGLNWNKIPLSLME